MRPEWFEFLGSVVLVALCLSVGWNVIKWTSSDEEWVENLFKFFTGMGFVFFLIVILGIIFVILAVIFERVFSLFS